jgi:hypothetical protein
MRPSYTENAAGFIRPLVGSGEPSWGVHIILVSDGGVGECVDPEGNGVNPWEGAEGGA